MIFTREAGRCRACHISVKTYRGKMNTEKISDKKKEKILIIHSVVCSIIQMVNAFILNQSFIPN